MASYFLPVFLTPSQIEPLYTLNLTIILECQGVGSPKNTEPKHSVMMMEHSVSVEKVN